MLAKGGLLLSAESAGFLLMRLLASLRKLLDEMCVMGIPRIATPKGLEHGLGHWILRSSGEMTVESW